MDLPSSKVIKGWLVSHSFSIRAASAALRAPARTSARGNPGVVVPRMNLLTAQIIDDSRTENMEENHNVRVISGVYA